MSHEILTNDLWWFIGLKLHSVADRIRFRAVSRIWNSLLPARQPPWLMLAEKEQEEKAAVSPPRRGFVSLGQQTIHEIEFPEVHQARAVGSTGNWLITIHLDKTLRLLNPFSRSEIYLPSSTSLDHSTRATHVYISPEIYRDSFVWKIVLSSSPCQPNCIAIALHDSRHIVAMARPGDKSWTLLQTPYTYTNKRRALFIQDVIFYKHQFYGIDKYGKLVVCDIDNNGSDPPKLSYLCDISIEINHRFPNIYLVEWSGELLLVIKIVENLDDPDDYETDGFEVYKFDFLNKRWNELKNLGEYSLFLGFNTSVSLLASDYDDGLVKKNCICFTDDYTFGYRGNRIPGGHDMGVFDLEDNSISYHYEGESTSLYSPPVWIIPS